MKRVFHRLRQISPPARSILKGGLMVSCTLLLSTVLFLLKAFPLSEHTYGLLQYALQLKDCTFTVLFITIFGSAFIEEQYIKVSK